MAGGIGGRNKVNWRPNRNDHDVAATAKVNRAPCSTTTHVEKCTKEDTLIFRGEKYTKNSTPKWGAAPKPCTRAGMCKTDRGSPHQTIYSTCFPRDGDYYLYLFARICATVVVGVGDRHWCCCSRASFSVRVRIVCWVIVSWRVDMKPDVCVVSLPVVRVFCGAHSKRPTFVSNWSKPHNQH